MRTPPVSSVFAAGGPRISKKKALLVNGVITAEGQRFDPVLHLPVGGLQHVDIPL